MVGIVDDVQKSLTVDGQSGPSMVVISLANGEGGRPLARATVERPDAYAESFRR